MDDQFGGRTDDDLFADDFEPLESKPVVPIARVQPVETAVAIPASTDSSTPTPASAKAAPQQKAAPAKTGPAKQPTQPKAASGKRHAVAKVKNALENADTPAKAPSGASSAQPGAVPPPSLALSRHNRPETSDKQPASAPQPPAGVRHGGKPAKGPVDRAETTDKAAKTDRADKSDKRKNERSPKERTDKKPEKKGRGGRGVSNGVGKSAEIEADTVAETSDRKEATPVAPSAKDATSAAADDAPASTANSVSSPSAKAAKGAQGRPAANNHTGGIKSSRLQSGANPRSKLTDAELNAKMEAMRIASLEKARRFEQAQRDQRDHELAFARSVEEARRRKAADEEKRRRGEEDRRRLEEERAKNRDRKLKAMGMKDSSWDDGKEAPVPNGHSHGHRGGMRGSRHAGGILPVANLNLADGVVPGSASGTSNANGNGIKEFQPGEFRGGGRRGRSQGRGRGGGRGGSRRFFDDVYGNGADVAEWVQGQPDPSAMAPPGTEAAELSRDAFPSLPGSAEKDKTDKTDKPAAAVEAAKDKTYKDAAAVAASTSLLMVPPLSPPIGSWDDEVAAMDAERAAAGKN